MLTKKHTANNCKSKVNAKSSHAEMMTSHVVGIVLLDSKGRSSLYF